MAETITLTRPFSIDMPDGSRRTWPAGWSGRMGTTLARQAIDGGYTAAAPADAGGGGKPERELFDKSQPRANLEAIARERGLDPAQYRTKADLVAALNG